MRTIQYLGQMVVNKQAVVSLKCDKGTSYKAYIEVQDQLAAESSLFYNMVLSFRLCRCWCYNLIKFII